MKYGNHLHAFSMIRLRREISLSLSFSISMCFACTSVNSLRCCFCCSCTMVCSFSILSSRVVTSSYSCLFSCLSSLISPLPKREPTFAIRAAFASVLTASSFCVPISFLTCFNCFSASSLSSWSCCTPVSSLPVCRFKSR